MGHACFFFLTEARIPDRVATHTQVECMGHACLFFRTEAKIPDRVATRNSGGGTQLLVITTSLVIAATFSSLASLHKRVLRFLPKFCE